MATGWTEVGEHVYLRRHESWDLNVGLIVGHEQCLVVDTRVSPVEGRELAQAVRTVTALPWVVANTHAHLDHVLGNSAFRPAAIWGHTRCAASLTADGATQLANLRASADEADRDALAGAEILVPDRVFDSQTTLDLGGRTVVLRYLGRGHTDGDIVVAVPHADVTFAGDLIRESGAPWFEDAFPLDWPATLSRLEQTATGSVVPGHGKVVDLAFVADQRSLLASVAQSIQAAHAAGRPIDDVVPDLPFAERTARYALTRAYRQLAETAGRPAR